MTDSQFHLSPLQNFILTLLEHRKRKVHANTEASS